MQESTRRSHLFLRAIYLAAAFLAVPVGLSAQPAQFGASPSLFELEIGDQPVHDSVRLFNFGEKETEVKVSVVNWDLDEANQVRLVEPDEQSLDQWMVINPLRFKIPARGAQTVRFAVRPRVRPAPGEHRAMLYFDEVPSADKGSGDGGVQVNFRLGIAVYGYAGRVERQGHLHGVEMVAGETPEATRTALFDITSRGTAHVRLAGEYAIWPAASYPGPAATHAFGNLGRGDRELPEPIVAAGILPNRPVLPGSRRFIQLPLTAEIAPGDYVLDINGKLGESPVDRSVPFTVAAPPDRTAASR